MRTFELQCIQESSERQRAHARERHLTREGERGRAFDRGQEGIGRCWQRWAFTAPAADQRMYRRNQARPAGRHWKSRNWQLSAERESGSLKEAIR